MAPVNQDNTELSDKNNINLSETGTSNEVLQPEQLTFSEKIRRIIVSITVEPFLLCYLLPSVISAVTVQKINFEKACRTDLGYSETLCIDVLNGDVSTNESNAALDDAQNLVAELAVWKSPLQSSIPAILILFVGAWSDRTGNRKALMLIPILGELVASIGMILATYFFEWPLWITGLIEALPSALSGGWSIALMGSYSFIADITTIESRTFRIGLVAVMVTFGIPIGSAISGVLTESIGYYGIFGINVAFYAVGFIYVYFRIRDVKKDESPKSFFRNIIEFFHPKNVWETVSLLTSSRVPQKRQILLIIVVHMVLLGPVFGEGAVLYLYVLKKFSMTIIEYSLFSTYSVLIGLAGTAIAVTVFSKVLKMHDALLGIIATTCKVASSFVYAFAPTRTFFYAGPVFDLFGNTGSIAIRSLGTKVVLPEQVAKICSLIGLAEAFVPVIYTPMYSKIYAKTYQDFSGTFYVVGGVMTVPAFFIFIYLYIKHKKQERDVVKNPENKEKYAHDNAVTVL